MNVLASVELGITQFAGQVRMSQKLLKYFNGTAISISFVLPSAGVLPVILTLNLNDSESGIVTSGLNLALALQHPILLH